jgi:geranylgeranyl reductase family protein
MQTERSIAIVGGGPSGALAAQLLAVSGRRVFLFDEKLAWEKPCGGGLTHKALKKYPFLREAKTEFNDIRHCEIVSPSGRRAQFAMRHPIAIFSRLALNGLLLDRACVAGANLRRERVTRIVGVEGNWRLTTTHAEYQASSLILAAGARNPFRAQFLPPISPEDLLVTAGYFIPTRSSVVQIQFLKKIAGYIWIFPRSDHLSAGIAARMGEIRTCDLRRTLEGWLEQNGFELEGAQFYSHILPALRAQTLDSLEVCGEGWAMIGDSAGLVDPITGEGLYYALRSAELCAQAVLAGNLDQYGASIEKEILPELRLAARLSNRFYNGQVFGESVLEKMVALAQQSEKIRDLMSDLFAGIQEYSDLRSRLLRILPGVMVDSLRGSGIPGNLAESI